MDKLQELSVEQLLDFSLGKGMPLNGFHPLRFGPVLDAYTLPVAPFDPVASEVSTNVPMIIGTTETEATWNANQKYDPLDDKALHDQVKRILRADDAATDRVIAVYKKNRPKASNLDLYLIVASDAGMRQGPELEADRKAMAGKAPVYKYYFQWYS